MPTRWLCVVLALLSATAAPVVAAPKEKGRPDPSGLALWSAKGMPLISRQYIPGLNAALLLSDQQIEHLYAAWRETVDSPDLIEKGRRLKETANPTEEQQKEVRLLTEAAQGRLQARVAGILTSAQKDWMLSIEVVYGQAQEAVNGELVSEFAAVKANAEEAERVYQLAKDRLAAEFRRRVGEILPAEQLKALEAAAADEHRRAAEAAAVPKK